MSVEVCVLPAAAEPGLSGSPAVAGFVRYAAAPGGGAGRDVKEPEETPNSEELLTRRK